MVVDVISAVLILVGCFVALTSGVGVLRLPDFYSRVHPAGKNDSFAQVLILGGLILQAGFSLVSLKLALIGLFLLITTPSSTYAIARAALIDGKQPWQAQAGGARREAERPSDPETNDSAEEDA